MRDFLIEKAGVAVAERVRKHLWTRINRLIRTPNLGVETSDPDIRMLPATRYPFRTVWPPTCVLYTVCPPPDTISTAPPPAM